MESSLSRKNKYRNGRPPFKSGYIRIIRNTGWLRSTLKRIPGSPYVRFVQIDGELLTIHQERNTPAKHSYSLFGSITHYSPNKKEFELEIGVHQFSVHCDTAEDAEEWVSSITEASNRSFDKFYDLGEKIGQNYFICFDKARIDRSFQVELIETPSGTDPTILSAISTQRRALSILDCTCINGTLDMFRNHSSAHFVRVRRNRTMSVRSLLDAKGPRTEEAVRVITYSILCALRHMHSHCMSHRNVRPENVLLLVDENRALLDNLSWTKPFPNNRVDVNVFNGHIGAISAYTPPEIFHGKKYGPAADVYAAGAVIYELLSGNPPPGDGQKFREKRWEKLTAQARSCVAQMLQKVIEKRPAPVALLEHAWIRQDAQFSSQLDCSRSMINQNLADHTSFMKDIDRYGLQETKARDPGGFNRMLSDPRTQTALARRFTMRREFIVNSRAILVCVRLMNASRIRKRAKRWAPPLSHYHKYKNSSKDEKTDENPPS